MRYIMDIRSYLMLFVKSAITPYLKFQHDIEGSASHPTSTDFICFGL